MDAYLSHLCFVLLFSALLVYGVTGALSAFQAASTVCSVFPSTVNAGLGQNITIDIVISDVFDLFGWELKFGWNASLLDLVQVSEGSFLEFGGDTFFAYKEDVSGSYVIVDCTLEGLMPGVSGSGILVSLFFYVENAGECVLDLYDVLLLNSFEYTIPSLVADGYGNFVSHDVTVVSVDLLPSTVVQGDLIDVNVTVQNQGQFTETFNLSALADSEPIGTQSVSLSAGSVATVSFVWNTSEFSEGEYVVSGSASAVLGELDTEDNSRMADVRVTILLEGHDIAVTGVEPLKTVVGQGYSMFISVSVANYGTFDEIVSVLVVANETSIQTQTLEILSGNTTTIVFVWYTDTYSNGDYFAVAFAQPVSGETDTSDNDLTAIQIVRITTSGDISGDFKVGPADFAILSSAYGSASTDSDWIPNADIDNNGKVGPSDFAILSSCYGQHWP